MRGGNSPGRLAEAVSTSLRVAAQNPVTVGAWGLIVAALLVVGSLPAFLGLAVVVPLLGHATWHLYRRAVTPVALGSHVRERPNLGQRYAAEFPASLFSWRRDKT